MAIITFDDYRKDPNHRRLVESLEANWGIPLPDFIKKIVVDTGTKAVWKIENAKRWISKLNSLVTNIVNDESNAEHFPLFWIYLSGVINEYYHDQIEFREIMDKISFMVPILESLDLIKGQFTEEERNFIKFMRDSHVHMHLDSLWYRPVMKNGKLIDIKPPKNPTARKNAENIVEEYGGDQESVAGEFAGRIIEDIGKLNTAVIAAAED